MLTAQNLSEYTKEDALEFTTIFSPVAATTADSPLGVTVTSAPEVGQLREKPVIL